ncbi:MAG TPA: penicillin-binding protein [Chitinophagales bacterium]|nr:penicillin-binding protein [Chitinophagales bacterium]
MNIKSNILFRIYLVGGFCTLFGVAVLAKVFMIQTDKKHNWKAMSDNLTRDTFDIIAERGNIYSADDKLLATSVPFFELHIDFASKAMTQEIFNKNVDSLAYYMTKKIGKNSYQAYRQQLIKARKQKRRYFPLIDKANYTELKEIKQWPLFREGKFKGGLIIETHQERTNPYGILAQRTIGLIRENAQDIGLEEAVDSLLKGVNGKVLKQKIAGGEWVPVKGTGQIEPKNGYDIITTIDLGLQDIAETSLLNSLTTSQAEFGCAVLMEVKTGAIKAIANLGKNKSGSYSENYNYALGLSNEPGSVFKMAGYLSLFDDGFITTSDSINTNGARGVFGGRVLTDDGHNEQYNFLTPGKAFAVSSNVAIASWLTKYYTGKKEKYYAKLQQFGLTMPTHIDLKGERKPFINKPENWSAMSLAWMAHGYEVKLTPLQILAFYNAIVNNGNRVKPYLIQKVLNNGKTIREYKPASSSHIICSERAAAMAKEIMLRVVEDEKGTGRGIKSPYYRIGGKTGTAKMSEGNSGYSDKNLSTFVGFFPAEAPLYSCIVVVGGPQGALTTGGAISAPIFRTMADKIITSNIIANQSINKDSTIANQPIPYFVGTPDDVNAINKRFKIKFDFKEDWDYAFVKSNSSNKIGIGKIDVTQHTVPNVYGMLLDDAIYLLENKGIKVTFSGTGKVKQQSQTAGTPVIKGSVIHLILNNNKQL